MINELELRIGNWVNTPDGYREIMSIYKGNNVGVRTFPADIAPSEASWNFPLSDISPIKITASNSEGFNLTKLKNIVPLLQVVQSAPMAIPQEFYIVMEIAGKAAVKIEYVHELQNIYIDITHEYLEFDPKKSRSKLTIVR